MSRLYACTISLLVVFIGTFGCKKTPAVPSSSIKVADDPAQCAEVKRQVDVLQQLVDERMNPPAGQAAGQAAVANAAEPNASGKQACDAERVASWDASIGVCRCDADPELRQANSWSIKNAFSCPDQGQKSACDGAGGKWNVGVGRCECPNDPTKFQANAFSIRNHLKCNDTATTDSNTAASGEEPFWWGYDECMAANGTSDYNGKCSCSDGKALVSQFDKCSESAGTESKPDTSGEVLLALQGGTKSNQAAAQNDHDGMLETYVEQLKQRKADLASCLAGASAQAAGAGAGAAAGIETNGCKAAGGTLDSSNTCRCSNNTPVFKLRNETCQEHLAKQNDACTKGNGLILYDDTCRCADGEPIFKRKNATCATPFWSSTVASGSAIANAAAGVGDNAGKVNSTAGSEVNAQPSSRGSCLCAYFQGKSVLYTYVADAPHRDGNGKKGDNVALAWTDESLDDAMCTEMAQGSTKYTPSGKYSAKALCNGKGTVVYDVPESD
jgi:hypothetical protein